MGYDDLSMRAPLSKYEALVDFDMYMEPFIGWRAWNIVVQGETVRLQSLTYCTTLWKPEEPLVARCKNRKWTQDATLHCAPNKEHSCGIYAVKERDAAIKWMDKNANTRKLHCVGEVKVWGVVYHYTNGYLSEKAYPSKIWVSHDVPEHFPIDTREAVHELRREYRGVEVYAL